MVFAAPAFVEQHSQKNIRQSLPDISQTEHAEK